MERTPPRATAASAHSCRGQPQRRSAGIAASAGTEPETMTSPRATVRATNAGGWPPRSRANRRKAPVEWRAPRHRGQ
eukprot:15468981-Alexandrium_andersonii.AAC.1